MTSVLASIPPLTIFEERAIDLQARNIAEERIHEIQLNAHLWGFLKPTSPDFAQIDFWKLKAQYRLGRIDDERNDICLMGGKISGHQCTIAWDGQEDSNSQVMIHDHSSNGTYINGTLIGQGRYSTLKDSDVIAFASPEIIRYPDGTTMDYRFQFHHMIVRSARLAIETLYSKHTDLGQGTFGSVWRALDHKRSMMVAIKTIYTDKPLGLKGHYSQTKSQRCRSICREVTIMEQVTHPNVCEILEFFYEPESDEIHIVMEYVPGGDLLSFIHAHEEIEEDVGRHIAYEICLGVGYLHEQGITHRDLKPENILVTLDNPPRVKISDFGLSKLATDKSILQSMVGTATYMAPELFSSKGEVATRYSQLIDSWAIGIIVHAMFTKEFPYNYIATGSPPALAPLAFDGKFNNLVYQCRKFIIRLLDPSPKLRMSVTTALEHPWLREWVPVYDNKDWYDAHKVPKKKSESWKKALQMLEEDADRAERQERGLATVLEEPGEFEATTQPPVIAQPPAPRRQLRIKGVEAKVPTRRSLRVASKKGLCKQETPHPPGYLH